MKPRSVMMYGVSGSTKTSQCYHIVRYLHGTKDKPGPLYGKYWRMIHSDGGGYAPFVDSGLIAAGIVKVFDFAKWPYSLSGWRWLQQGYWPRKVSYSQHGLRYPDGEHVTGTCAGFMKADLFMTKPEEWNQIAGYLIEGMASTGEVMKTHVSNQKEGVGFKEAWKYEEEGEMFLGLQQGHYGLIQKEIYTGHVKGFNNLPIPWLVYTSLLGKGEDKQNRETVYGPQIVGQAATPASPQWFMDCLHLSKERFKKHNQDGSEGVETEQMVAWFTQHNDLSTGVPYLCKPRLLPEKMPELTKMFPYGFIPLGFKRGVDVYLETLDILNQSLVKEVWK